jgi:hypothetical protein
MFYASEMLRYNNENQYKTFTGGVITLGILTTIMIAFASMIFETLDRTKITYTLDVKKRADPTNYTLEATK